MKKRILVVDDSLFMRNIIKNILTKNGYIIAGEASNGIEAAEKYSILHPDIVTMDIVMDKVNGIDAVKMIKEKDPNAVIVMCTSMGQKCMLNESIANGAKDFIIKPFHEAKLLETINNHNKL